MYYGYKKITQTFKVTYSAPETWTDSREECHLSQMNNQALWPFQFQIFFTTCISLASSCHLTLPNVLELIHLYCRGLTSWEQDVCSDQQLQLYCLANQRAADTDCSPIGSKGHLSIAQHVHVTSEAWPYRNIYHLLPTRKNKISYSKAWIMWNISQ